MFKTVIKSFLFITVLAFGVAVAQDSSPSSLSKPAGAQKSDDKAAAMDDADSAKRSNSKDDKAMSGTPVLWRSTNVSAFDTFNGPGGDALRPDTSKITFVEVETGGYSKKFRIKDGAGRTWVAKVSDEAQSETAAVRLIAALGYPTEINYLVPELTIPGQGTFKNVRLELRPENVKRGDSWSWTDNPFKGTREFQGLKIMMAFLNNWDMKQANNVIIQNGDTVEYVISDLGVSFGKTGNKGMPIFWRVGRSRNVPVEYSEEEFIKNAKDGKINFNFNGKNDGALGDVTHEDGRWLADLLLQLTDKQINDAFRAANYTETERALLVQGVKNRIRALDLAVPATARSIDSKGE